MQLPPALIASLQHVTGFDETAFKQVHQSGKQVTSVRLNPYKVSRNFTSEETALSILQYKAAVVPWCSNAFYLSERPSFTVDPMFHAGSYYVQEASSMFVEEALRQTTDLTQPLRVLDLCAAPGGKSTLIQSLLSGQSLLVSNEVIKTRVNILAENIAKWGAANVIVTNNDPKDFQRLGQYFDVIVVDAPCSGSGLFRKDPEAITEWSEQNVALCSQRQQRILADILPALKEGGVLIYSTCSYSKEEDETIAAWLLEEMAMESLRLTTTSPGITETVADKHNAYGYRFYPDKIQGEGFFIAAFKKLVDATGGKALKKQKGKSEKLTAKEVAVVQPYLKNPGDFFFIRQNDEVLAVPCIFEEDLIAIQHALYIKKAGVKMGAIIRNELIPDHELAISTIIHPSVPSVAVDEATALQYLRRNDIVIDTAVKGWALVTFNVLPLGWAKILPNRINNYYPREWRILNK